ncbi:MAG: chromosomal replication initiator protein DnaA, partial [Clostridia bacterium]|nr:chromosomal replication initiator protein DnaA [Clostridia bacterium]
MIDIKQLWKDACSCVIGIKGVNAVSYSVWIDSLTPLCVKDNSLILLAPSSNNKITVNRSYKDAIIEALTRIGSMITDVTVIIEEEKNLYEDEIKEYSAVTKEKPALDVKSQFIARYTFDNFVVGDSNNLAYHAAINVAQSPGVSNNTYLAFNPLFLYGGVGLGKTHLLHSIGNYIADNHPELKVLYTPTEKLINDYVDAISSNKIVAFRTKYRDVDVLMIDDVQFLQKRVGLQEVVFHIFNDLYQNGKQIVLTSDRPPAEIATLEDRLRSRFEGGLLADIGAPNLDMRIAIIRKKMLLEKIAVNDDVVYFLAEKCDSNIRELEGNLSRVVF